MDPRDMTEELGSRDPRDMTDPLDERGSTLSSDALGERSSAQRHVIEDLIYEHARVAGDVVQIDPQTWAIHGPIAVDSDVIMAAFNSRDEAEAAIKDLRAAEVR
jgi:hypothetical protein